MRISLSLIVIGFWVFGGILSAEVVPHDTSEEHNPYRQTKDTPAEQKNVHEELIQSAAQAAEAIRDYFKFRRYVFRQTENHNTIYSIDLSGYQKLLEQGLKVSHSMEQAKAFLFLRPELDHLTPVMDKTDRRGEFARIYFEELKNNAPRIKTDFKATPVDLRDLAEHVDYLRRVTKQRGYETLASEFDPELKSRSWLRQILYHAKCAWTRLSGLH